MDLNYILHRHQVSLIASTNAACPASRHAHRGLVIGYARQIRDFQKANGAAARLAVAA